MGLTIADGVYDFFHEALQTDFHGKSLLMLGKQRISIGLVHYYVMAERLGVELDDIVPRCTPLGDIDAFSFFFGMGFSDVHAMDVSNYEDADIIFDLNSTELPNDLQNRFDYIVDGGTLEHCFHAGQALKNIAKMLKVGGKVFHYLPASGWINHGFYTISPSLLNDFYMANGFVVLDSKIVLFNEIFEKHISEHILPQSLEECLSTAIDYRVSNISNGRFDLLHQYKGVLRCIAQKNTDKPLETPIQRHWYGRGRRGHGLIKGLGLLEYHPGEIAIWGMGNTAMKFLNMLREAEYPMDRIRGIFVSSPNCSEYQGHPVLNFKKIDNYAIKTIIIAANKYEDEIYSDIRCLETKGIQIVGLKKYAGCF